MKTKLASYLKSLTLVALFSTTTFASINATAFEGTHMHGGAMFDHMEGSKHKKRHHRMMAKYLALSDEQKSQMKSIRQSAKEEAVELSELLSSYKERVKLLIAAESFDQAAFADLHAEYQENFAQLALLRAKTKHAMKNLLTAGQQERWADFMPQKKRS